MRYIHLAKRYLRRYSKITIALGLGLFIGITSSVMVKAAVPDVQGRVHACFQTSGLLADGQARIIDSPAQSCNGNETAVSLDKASPGNFVSNLVNADLTGANLAYRNFAEQDMHGSTFHSANLNGGVFTNANLSSSLFGTNNVPSIMSRNAKFIGTNFNNTQFSGTIDFTGAVFDDATFNNASWSSTYLTGGDFREANMTNSALDGYFNYVDFRNVDFRSMQSWIGTFAFSNLSNANFVGISNLGLQFTDDTNLTNAQFNGATLNGATFRFSPVDGADFTNAQFLNANLQGTNFTGANLTGATWSNTICPNGSNSDNNNNTCLSNLVP